MSRHWTINFIQDKTFIEQFSQLLNTEIPKNTMEHLTDGAGKLPADCRSADCLKYPPRFLTSAEHGLEQLGEAMLRLLIQRIDQHGADVPAHIEPSRFLIGNTTPEHENALFDHRQNP
jgi:hypothetical protein